MFRQRKNFSVEFKSDIVLQLLKGEKNFNIKGEGARIVIG